MKPYPGSRCRRHELCAAGVRYIILPGATSGPELAAKLQATRPRLKAVFMSGYSNEAMQEVFALGQDVQFLHKPYRTHALIKAVRDALDGRTSTRYPWSSPPQGVKSNGEGKPNGSRPAQP